MMGPAIASFTWGTGPVIATAIHAGSFMRRSILRYCRLDRAQRLREEDPFTERLADIAPNRIIGERSRFEVDLNRPRDKAIYMRPQDAWGLDVWDGLPEDEQKISLCLYDQFYDEMRRALDALLKRHSRLVIFDVHSYNHQRGGEGILDDPGANPDINLGTGNMDRVAWAPVVDTVIDRLRMPLPSGQVLDVRENIKFRGGHFTRWVHQVYGGLVCPLAVEFKKIFMNEWTGVPDIQLVEQLRSHLEYATAAVVDHLHEKNSV